MTSETLSSAPSAIDITTLAWESPAPPDVLPFDWHPFVTEENWWQALKAVFPRNFREQDHAGREVLLYNFTWPLLILFPHHINELGPNQEDHANIAAELASSQFNPYRANLALFLKTVWPDDITPVAEKTLRALEKRAATKEWTDTYNTWDRTSLATLTMATHAKILDPEKFSHLAISQAAWDELEEIIIKKGEVSLAKDRRNKLWLVSRLALVKILLPNLYSKIAPNANEWAEIKRDIEEKIGLSSYTTEGILTYIAHAAICAARKVECTGNGRLELLTEETTFTAPTPPMPPIRRF